ncbi:MAG TPA: tripartite tricarboxylate transporter substrate binding protein, partial [Burkholderiaceae bacterium]|nr:tripartite tricarboxylate transporter substrate binding protein [Burkholderiaceae bacterium]
MTTTDRNRRRLIAGLGALGAGALGAPAAAFAQGQAQPFPGKVIRIIPFGTSGGPIDITARVYAEKLQQRWPQSSIIIEAKPGAAGMIAANWVARAPADGNTMLMTLSLTHINHAILQPKLQYDPVKDFEPLSQLATGGPMMVARANDPYSNVREFVAHAKQRPRMTYGTWGNGSTAHLFCELLKRQTGTNLEHVAYKAEAPAHADMFGGVLDFAWANPATARGHVQGGKMKVLGITGSKRVSVMPDVPTFTEQGFKGFDLDSWIGCYLPAGTPKPIVDEWVTALREATQTQEVRQR